MAGRLNNTEVVCCFCGASLNINEALIITIRPNVSSEDTQNLFSHRFHLIEHLHKSIILHPDIFEDDQVDSN